MLRDIRASGVSCEGEERGGSVIKKLTTFLVRIKAKTRESLLFLPDCGFGTNSPRFSLRPLFNCMACEFSVDARV